MDSLSRLSNMELEVRLKDLVHKERKLLHVILEHIREFDARKLYLGKAYSSIYEYLTKELGYSGSAAMRRLEAARLLRDVPQVAELIQEGSLNLSQIGELSRSIKEKEKISGEKVCASQKQELIEVVIGKTTQETQHELARVLDLPLKEYDFQRMQKDESVRLEVTPSKAQYEKLLQCKDLAAHILLQGGGTASMTDVIEFLADQYLNEKFKPTKIKDKSQAISKDQSLIKTKDSKPAMITTDAVVDRKSVTPKLRGLILKRDKCCQFINYKTGRKCGSTFALQIDHKMPKWVGGMNSMSNLQVLCGEHNRYKYKTEKNLKSFGVN
ncbi:HNH endonuclease [Bdellovibrio reynosensis]|uniref:HNH endonuclease n=1 Tax=Bdellovibrio reynosensis TaxID=2835041 RepID=A0ABY4CC49_9BACT|nr:HNH endonuclease signature motif containing protein [Bdellovibrio reynosensis]UOF02418.1 HNH endonuclease [Bdellovibrio reynosensis]